MSRTAILVSLTTLLSTSLLGCATEADSGTDVDPWHALTPGDGLEDGTRRPTGAVTAAAFYVDSEDRVFRSDVAAVPLPSELTSLPGSESVEAPPEELRPPIANLIFGADNRTPYTATSTLTGYNKRTIGRLILEGGGQCTGSLVGPRHVLTSAHCVLDDAGGFTSTAAMRFSPGHRGDGFGTKDPNGAARKAVGYYARVSNDTWDYALIILEDKPETASLGWMGFRWSSSDDWYEGKTMSTAGYPGASQICWTAPSGSPTFPMCGEFQYGDQCVIDWADEDIEFECDVTKGQSGSPAYIWTNGMPDVIGVVRGSTSTPFNDWNKAVRLNHAKLGDLCSWILTHPSAYATRQCAL